MNSKMRRKESRIPKQKAHAEEQNRIRLVRETGIGKPKAKELAKLEKRENKSVAVNKKKRHGVDTSMQPSLPKLKRGSGLMSHHRKRHQKAISNPNGIEMYRDLTLAQQIITY